MRIGKYKHRILIYKPEHSRDDTGAYSITGMEQIAERWANVKYLSGRELSYAQQNQTQYNIEITLRHIELDEEMMIVYGEKYYEIKAIIPDDTNTELILLCVENKNPITFTNQEEVTALSFTASGGMNLGN